MAGEYHIICNNAFITIAMQHMLKEIDSEIPWHHLNLLRILVVKGKDPIDELAIYSNIEAENYDIILCTAFYHSVIVNFFPGLRHKFIRLDNDCEGVKRDIKNVLLNRDRKDTLPEGHYPVLTFTPADMRFINDYLSCLCIKQIARKENWGVKSVSNRKRLIMAKVNSQSNLELWITLKFLMFFDHPGLFALDYKRTARHTRLRPGKTLRQTVGDIAACTKRWHC